MTGQSPIRRGVYVAIPCILLLLACNNHPNPADMDSFYIDVEGNRVDPVGPPSDLDESEVDALIQAEMIDLESVGFSAHIPIAWYPDGFSEGLAPIGAGVEEDPHNRIYGYINPDGAWEIEPRFTRASRFSEGLAAVAEGDPRSDMRWGYIDRTGRYAIAPTFSEAYEFVDGLAPVSGPSGTGFIDRDGVLRVSDPQWKRIGRYHEGLAPVAIQAGRWGYVDREGAFQIPPQFNTHALAFSEELAAVCVNGEWGYINREGEMVIPPQFHAAGDFNDGIASVSRADATTRVAQGFMGTVFSVLDWAIGSGISVSRQTEVASSYGQKNSIDVPAGVFIVLKNEDHYAAFKFTEKLEGRMGWRYEWIAASDCHGPWDPAALRRGHGEVFEHYHREPMSDGTISLTDQGSELYVQLCDTWRIEWSFPLWIYPPEDMEFAITSATHAEDIRIDELEFKQVRPNAT